MHCVCAYLKVCSRVQYVVYVIKLENNFNAFSWT